MPEPLAPGVWEPAQGALYSLHGDHEVRKLADRLGISNGLDWSPDQRTFYHVDSLDYAVYAYDYDVQAGTIGERGGDLVPMSFSPWPRRPQRPCPVSPQRTAGSCSSCRGAGRCPTGCAWTAQGRCGWRASTGAA